MGKQINMTNYIDQLKKVFSMMPIGKLFQIKDASWDQRGLIIFSVVLYFVQMYQNSMTCYKFYSHSKDMAYTIHEVGYYCNLTASSMETFKSITDKMHSYSGFNSSIEQHISKLRALGTKFLDISSSTFHSMGSRMKIYYDLYCDKDYELLLNYTFNYNEYIENIKSFNTLPNLNPCKFSSNKFSYKNSYYSLLKDIDPVKNSYSMKKNAILSGPNASGKTTLLKSTMINTLLCQRIGAGFFESATIIPQDYFHCYINIPDTCDRDSLFQGEARRCKEIIDIIQSAPNSRHLCVFDELFSGTNPYEAVASATGYLNFLHKNKHVRYLLTTHYLDLCNSFKNSNSTNNYTLNKSYSLQKGISTIKGGISVLEEMEFPEEIINTAKKLVS